ncbi:TetR/AcrR family transcriptional regulator [Miniphocaeibacter halophilus]|uniref:TetR family transcriptional regulator n=1 Tax=Miniphocaeibacter halophilus TaxID=2931922 RepID=A0AC61MRL1_9FIRM|nr:TetR family transcriptional regulator [Miniphocaeibacter halophilus]QQK08214.1 TetR family transcriptional regulator [Miniphocaeibacter halophilus]
MAIDMKEVLASATRELIEEKGIDKVTIKDIVAKCNITRQSFYYHFEDFDDLFSWIIERNIEEVYRNSQQIDNMKDSIKLFIKFVIEYKPLFFNIKNSKRREDFEFIISKITKKYIGKMLLEKSHKLNLSISDFEVALKFYSFGVLGLLISTDVGDNEGEIDELAEKICNLLTGKLIIFK